MDVSVRLLRYFLAVAEELHFTRAAERLFVAQPALSKAIRRLENELGMPLFARNRQGVALTDAGRSLVPVARGMLREFDAWHGLARDAQRAVAQVFAVGYHTSIGADLLKLITEAFARSRPDRRLALRLGDWGDPAGPVLAGRVRAALLPLPLAGQDRLDTAVLREDRRWVAMAAEHPLAGRGAVRLRDLRDEPFVALPASSGPLRSAWLPLGEHGAAATVAVEVDNSEDYFQAIVAGHGIAMLTESSTLAYPRPGITYRLVEDAPPSQLAVAWPRDDTDPVLRDFVRACLDAQRASVG